MSFEYPIFQILLYIALFFAPPDTNRIFIGAGDGELRTLERSGEAWEIQRIPHGDSPAIPEGRVFIEGDAVLLKKGDAWDPPFPMAEYVKLDRNHDWSRQPELRLPFGSVLAKTSDAVVLRVKDGTPEMKSYRIAYMPIEDGKRPTITVNVLGAVARPGAYTLGVDANVDELLLLAGGLVGGAEWDTMRILRGSADAPLKVVRGLRSPLLDGDTIYVPVRGAQVESKRGGRPETVEIEAQLNRVSAMKHILASALKYAERRDGQWPGNFEAMREQLSGTPLGGADEDLARVGRLFEYRAPGNPLADYSFESGGQAPRRPVLFELQPSPGVQFVGFSDGSVTGFSDVTRLRELGAPKPVAERLSFRWVGADGHVPAEFLPRTDQAGDAPKLSVFCETVLTGADVESAERATAGDSSTAVHVRLSEAGGRKLAEATARNLGRGLAIVLNERVLSAPTVMNAITGGSLMISGRFTETEVTELLGALNRVRADTRLPSMVQDNQPTPPEARDLPKLVPPVSPPETIRFGGVEWLPWRSLFEVRGDELVSLPKVRPGFDYGHWGHGRGPEVVTNIGNPDWRDYRIDADLLVPGVDPAFNPHGLGLDFHGAMIAFHVVDKKESFNESGTSAYILGFEGPGNWSLTAQYNNYCRQPRGWGNNQSDGERRLAGGSDVALDPVRGNRFRIEVRGDRIRIWIDGRKIVDLVDAQMGEPIGGRTLDHGGVAFVGGFDAMIRLRSFEITPLGMEPARPQLRATSK